MTVRNSAYSCVAIFSRRTSYALYRVLMKFIPPLRSYPSYALISALWMIMIMINIVT